MDYLKWGGKTPEFDVVEKTKEYYYNSQNATESMYDQDYVLRGPVVGPLTKKDLRDQQGESGFDLAKAFPDIERNGFGFTQDPNNPFRCFWFEKWTATNMGSLKIGPISLPASGKKMDGPVHVNAVVWTPEGKIIYESVGAVTDRFEGNTNGNAAVFGLLYTAGVPLSGSPGDRSLSLQQRIAFTLQELNLVKGLTAFSRERDIPKWWKNKARGAEQ